MTTPNYVELVKFLFRPFVEKLDTLKIDCETFRHHHRVWIRVALENEDKGRLLGQGKRNLQTIRSILNTAASQVKQSVFIEIYEAEPATDRNLPLRRRRSSAGSPPRRRTRSRGGKTL